MTSPEPPQLRFKMTSTAFGITQALANKILDMPFITPIGFKESFINWLLSIMGLTSPFYTAIFDLLDVGLVCFFLYAVLNIILIKWGMKMVFALGLLTGLAIGAAGYWYIVHMGVLGAEVVAAICAAPPFIWELKKAVS